MIAAHRDEAMCTLHGEMGFHEGWGTVLEQMVERVEKSRGVCGKRPGARSEPQASVVR